MLQAQADAYAKLFAVFLRHTDVIDRVTFWGLNDARSWRAGQNPLVFDRDNRAKPALQAIVNAAARRG
jgi:GH35 family endo-1,4-beta-xylanase